MEEVVKLLEDTVDNVNSKLNSVTRKLELYQSNVVNLIKNKPAYSMVSIIDLIKSFELVEEEHTKMLTTFENLNKELDSVRTELQSEIDLLQSDYNGIQEICNVKT